MQESIWLCVPEVEKALYRKSLLSLSTEMGKIIVKHGSGKKDEGLGQIIHVQRLRGKREGIRGRETNSMPGERG